MQGVVEGRVAPTIPQPRPPRKPPDGAPMPALEPVGAPPPRAAESAGARVPIESLTLMRAGPWRDFLTRGGARSYQALFPDAAHRILEGIVDGVPVDFEGDRTLGRDAPNHPIDAANWAEVDEIIAADVLAG